MDIVDAQIHLWGSGLPSNAAHRPVTWFTAGVGVALMDVGGVDAAVIHPVPWDDNSQQIAFDAVAAHPDRFAMLGELPPAAPDIAERVAHWRDTPGALGLRYLLLGDAAQQQLAAGVFDPLWAAAEAAGVPIAMLATDSLEELGRIAERHPGLRLTIDHLGGRGGNTTLKDHEAMVHMPALCALAKHPNIAVKATGAPGYSAEAYPYPIMQDYVRQIFDAFGPERTFWGTDITKMQCSWRDCIAMFTEEMPWLSGGDLEQVMGKAICAWWGWDR
ncbi:MAG: amidohydrolase family protein [Alphaproteobacteria bacterium]